MNNENQPDYGLSIAIGFVIASLVCILAAAKTPLPLNLLFWLLAVAFGVIGAIGTCIEVFRSVKK